MVDKLPLVSIILPTYNGERYISQSISSCLEQTYKNIELIVVNDCSTDNTLSIINEIAEQDPRLTIISNKENLRLPKSLNIGHKIANGSLITWHSDDNYYENDAIMEMVDCFKRNPFADIIYANFNIIDENGTFIKKEILKESEFLYHNNCIGACFLYRKEVFTSLVGYDDSLFLAEDYDFWIRAYENSTFYRLNKFLYNYRIHSNSLTSQQPNNIINAVISTQIKNISILEKKTNSSQKAFLYRKIILFDSLKRRIKLKYYFKLLVVSPFVLIKLIFKQIRSCFFNFKF
jgi:glycosyltransferase involved in cell wall biosynthesis